MTFTRWPHLLLRCCGLPFLLVVLPVAAQPAHPTADPASLIQRVRDAGRQSSFVGTFVVSADGQMTSSRITHYGDGRNQIELVESLDGQLRKVFRHNDEVRVLWPQSHHASIERRGPLRAFPGTITGGASGLDRYSVVHASDDRVAGLPAQVVLFKPRDELRFAQRWWLERQSGLLLRADMLGPHGEVLESSAFSSLQIGARVAPQPLLNEMRKLDGYHVNHSGQTSTNLSDEGWSLEPQVPGFLPISCIRRSVTLPLRTPRPRAGTPASDPSAPTEPPGGNGTALLQAIFGDGLTHVSIFIEPFTAHPGRTEAHAVLGATHAVTRHFGDWWITAVGDVPPQTLEQFVQALQYRRR